MYILQNMYSRQLSTKTKMHIVLDFFFAEAGTTAHAVLVAHKDDTANRTFRLNRTNGLYQKTVACERLQESN